MIKRRHHVETTLLVINGVATTILGLISLTFIVWAGSVLFLSAFG